VDAGTVAAPSSTGGGGQIALDPFRKGVDRGVVGHLLEFLVAFSIGYIEFAADSLEQLKSFRDLFLREQIDPEVEVIAGIAALLHSILLHEHEGAEQNALDRDGHGEQDERVRIEVWEE